MKCKNCKKEFIYRRKWQVFCCLKCRNNYWNRKKQINNGEKNNEIKEKEEVW